MAPIVSSGVWGSVTSTIDWCERNYDVNQYMAEFWNTISNTAMIMPSIIGCYHSYNQQIETRYVLCYIFLCLVGIGSSCFHMTLKYEMQLFDEIPMIWGSLILLYCLLTLLYPIIDNSITASLITKTCLILYGIVSTFTYLGFKTPLLFQISYGFLVTIMLYLDICVVKYKPCDVRVFYAASILYYTGFVLWNIDNMFCEYLDQMRQLIPSIFGPFTQFHALWHCMAGYGSYLHIIFCAQSRALTLNQNVVLICDWTGIKLKNKYPLKKLI